jgi:methylenetetrahydrofolate reductase (NADPH)
MHIQDIFKSRSTTFSFEFFPPKTDKAATELFETIEQLQALQPSFVSVTYGAGGSTRERTHDLVVRIQRETNLTAVSHLTCVCHSQDEIAAILDRYAESKIENILALGGDPPRTIAQSPAGVPDLQAYDRSRDAFQYAAELVRFIRSRETCAGARGFGIGVAGFPEGHPGTPNRLKEMDHLKQKVDAGADYICTQLFFSNADFYDFRERCELAGIRVPIIAGIMPITSKDNLARMAELALGARFPARLLRAIGRCDDDTKAVSKVGIHWATEQCRDLLDNQVRGVHFYTLNRSDATRRIYENLGLTRD